MLVSRLLVVSIFCPVILSLGNYSNSGFDRSSFLKTDNSNEFSSSCTTRIVPILTTGVSFLRSYKVSNKRPIMGHPRSDLGCPRSVLVGPGQSQVGPGLSQDGPGLAQASPSQTQTIPSLSWTILRQIWAGSEWDQSTQDWLMLHGVYHR